MLSKNKKPPAHLDVALRQLCLDDVTDDHLRGEEGGLRMRAFNKVQVAVVSILFTHLPRPEMGT